MNDRPRAPELHAGFAWLNTDRPLTFANELRGQVVLLDFWTYCCINCMHVLPDLAYLEEKYREEPFLVIGVHSAKFTNEGQRQTVRAAVGRYEIAHPVVIDENMRVWGEYAVGSSPAWPPAPTGPGGRGCTDPSDTAAPGSRTRPRTPRGSIIRRDSRSRTKRSMSRIPRTT